ncbi:ATPase, T2SS/T4P/T4SS family [Oceanimonas marisflavi]|uniref:ATPase, T2SS/T4P/T4SS family n=1 Tax=Oceanimonas marisflavi TaxID=2059724 RepID=UPI0018E551C5|nr:ATPase, T2SS/T4P/T4SS family [Oceanimonas marisflavi]
MHTKIGLISYITPTLKLTETGVLGALAACASGCIERGEWQQIIDLSHIERVNSAALECLLDIGEQLASLGGWLKTTHAQPVVSEVLNFTGIGNQIDLEELSQEILSATAGRSEEPARLGDILLSRGVINEQQLTEVIGLQDRLNKRMGDILLEKGWIRETQLLEALGGQLKLPFITLRPGLYDPEITRQIPAQTCKRLGIVPLFRLRHELLVATADPQQMPAFTELEELLRVHVRPVLACRENIQETLHTVYADGDDQLSNESLELIESQDQDLELVEKARIDDHARIDELAEGSPVIRLVNSILQRAVNDNVSDIHIEPDRSTARVRFRIDGLLYQVMTLRLELLPALVSRLKVMASLDISERRLPQDGRIQVQTRNRLVDLRFSSLPGLYGEKVVLRLLDKQHSLLDLNKLGMNAHSLAQYRQLLQRPYGLILVTGPTGSGKTTSLYAAINHLNSVEKNIVTIEDPVEYQLDIVNQNEVKEAIGLSFAKILRHVLRQDPDIVLVGEIRDRETAAIAVQAALTGHLVLSTLHTNNSAGAIVRMVDMGIEPYLLASALAGVVAQRLIRAICSHCKTQYLAPVEICQQHGWPTDGSVMLSRGRGCSECYDSGFKSRLAIHELMPNTPALQQLILQNPSLDTLEDYRIRQQIPSLFADGLERVRRGLTTAEEITRVINV